MRLEPALKVRYYVLKENPGPVLFSVLPASNNIMARVLPLQLPKRLPTCCTLASIATQKALTLAQPNFALQRMPHELRRLCHQTSIRHQTETSKKHATQDTDLAL